MDGGRSSDAGCNTTARGLELFNRRGSLFAVALGGVSSEAIASASQSNYHRCTASSGFSNFQNATGSGSGAMTSISAHNLATTSTASGATNFQVSSVVQFDTHSGSDADGNYQISTESNSEWRPSYPRLCAYHDCVSLASAWGLGPPTTSIEPRPTGASQAQSPCEDDAGDSKSNNILASCPAFRNELGGEETRRLALSRRIFKKKRSKNDTWLREHTAAEIGILEDVSNVYLGGRLCAARQQKIVIEPQDIGAYYYRHCFIGRPHWNFFGTDETYGPVAVSVVREGVERKAGNVQSTAIYRMIIRISDLCTLRVAIPEDVVSDSPDPKSTRYLLKELLEIVCPQIHYGILRPSNSTSTKVEDLLVKIDEQPIYTRYKVGVMYCGKDQSTEEQMYNNEHGSPAFEEFLDFLGQRVRLKGFDQYKGGLDVRGDTTGSHSIYSEYQAHEIMFHVSTLLPFTPSNRQQLARKRHIGNDMVTVIFQEPGALPFSPITVRSHFQHVFIVVRVNDPCTDDVTYSIAVSRAKDVPAFGPALPAGATFPKSSKFHDFLITKVINAENAVHRSKKFAAMAARTRREALKEVTENCASAHPTDGPSKIASRFLGGSVKRKERAPPRLHLGESLHGALSWFVEVHDHSQNQRVTCVLGISYETLVMLETVSGEVIFATPTHSIIGWANTELGLKIYFDHGDMLLMRCCLGDADEELSALIRRLKFVTKGDEAKDVAYRRAKASDSLGFHIQEEGVVTDVEMYQTAWKYGLRQGSRIVEIDGRPIATLNYNDMCAILSESISLRLIMISPAADGSPRRGCADPHCPAVGGSGNEVMLTPETFAKQSLNYSEMFKPNAVHAQNVSFDRKGAIDQSCSFEDSLVSKANVSYVQKLLKRDGNNRISYPMHKGVGWQTSSKQRSKPIKWNTITETQSPHETVRVLRPGRIIRVRSDESLSRRYIASIQQHMCGQPSSLQDFNDAKGSLVTREDVRRYTIRNIELEKCQEQLKKTQKEKQALEAMINRLKEELTKERRLHEMTKLELQKLQKYFEMIPNVSL